MTECGQCCEAVIINGWLVEEFIQSFVDTGGWKAAAGRGRMDMIGILFRGQRERGAVNYV